MDPLADYSFKFFTSHILFLYVVFPAGIAFLETIGILLTPTFTKEHRELLFEFYAPFLPGFVVIGLFKLLVWLILRKRKVEEDEAKRCKIELLIGLGGIFVSSVVPRIACFFVKAMKHQIHPVVALPYIPMLFFYIFFIYNAEIPVARLPWEKYTKLFVTALIVHVILFIVVARIAMAHEESQFLINFAQFIYFPISLSSSVEFLILTIDGLTMLSPEHRPKKPVRPKKDFARPPITEGLLYTFTFILIVLCQASLLYIVFLPIAVKTWICYGVTLLLCIVTLIGAMLLRSLMSNFCEFAPEIDQIKTSLFLGNGGCMLFGLVARVGISSVGESLEMLFPLIFTCLVASIISQYFFTYSSRKLCNLDHINHIALITIVVIIKVFALLIGIRSGRSCENREAMRTQILGQHVFFVFSLSSSIDFFVVLRDGVYLKKKEDVTVPLEPLLDAQVTLKPLPRIQCKVCNQEYSMTKTPRILKECGHTFCEECLDAQRNEQEYVVCGTCQAVTLVKGTASLLKKNLAVLSILEKDKN